MLSTVSRPVPLSVTARDRAAIVLLGYCVVVLLVSVALLFKGNLPFATTSSALSGVFVDPVLVALTVGAALLATRPESGRSGLARPITLAAVAVLGVMAVLGVLTFLSALGANDKAVRFGGLGGVPLAGRFAGTALMLAGLALVGAGLAYVGSILRTLPAPVREPKTAKPPKAPKAPKPSSKPPEPPPPPRDPPPPPTPPQAAPVPPTREQPVVWADPGPDDTESDDDENDRPIWQPRS